MGYIWMILRKMYGEMCRKCKNCIKFVIDTGACKKYNKDVYVTNVTFVKITIAIGLRNPETDPQRAGRIV